MAITNEFSEYYKTLSNTELLDILENQENYQSLAVETAKNEFNSRKLSEIEISEAKKPLIEKQLQKQKQSNKTKAIENKIKNAGNFFADTINPIHSSLPNTDKLIRLISLAYFAIFLFQFIKDFKSIAGYIEDLTSFPMLSVSYLTPLAVAPIAAFNFYKRKTRGWIMLAIFVSYSAVGALWMLIDLLSWKPSQFEGLHDLFPKSSSATYIIQLVFLTGTLYIIFKENIREVFKIDKQKALLIISLSGFLTLALMLLSS
ncbi:MAG TPA: hypothetical protein PLP23_22000 [Panacibacter sp.]|nr:hypothetical protein [Panacibacter sp.]